MSKENQVKLKLKVAFVGFGWVASQVWFPCFAARAEIEIVGILEPNKKEFGKELEDYPLIFCVDKEQIADLNPDLVIIATPTLYHAEFAEYFIKKMISILVEKPFVKDLTSFYRIKSILSQYPQVPIYLSRAARYRADIRQIKSLIDQNQLGKINKVELKWVRSRGIPKPGSWFTNKHLAGGGAMMDIGWHLFDACLFLLGNIDIVTISSFQTDSYLTNALEFKTEWRHDLQATSNLAMDVEDSMSVFIQTKDNCLIQLSVAWASHYPKDQTLITLHGKEAVLALETTFGFSSNRISPSLSIYKNGYQELIELESEEIGSEYHRQTHDIVNSLLLGSNNNKEVMSETENIMLLMEAVYSNVFNAV